MTTKQFYDLEAEELASIREAETRQREFQTMRELAAIREATQSLCALMMGMVVGP